MIIDKNGNLYGTTTGYGLNASGTAFELTPPSGTKAAWTVAILYDFCAQAKCADGSVPKSPLLIDSTGNLYGTTYSGGADNYGAVFRLTPDTGTTAWSETVLWSFGSPHDGVNPSGNLIMDVSGNLYGTTVLRGVKGFGTIFMLTPNVAAKTGWTEAVAWSFCTNEQGSLCLDGQAPYGGIIMDKSGNLYGTTVSGGTHNYGTVFEY